MKMILVTSKVLDAELASATGIPADRIEPTAYRWNERGAAVLHAPPAGRGCINGLLVPAEYADALTAAGIEYARHAYCGHA